MAEEKKVEEGQGTPVKETPTPDITALTSQVSQLRTELEQTKKGLSTAHQTLTERDKELKRRADLENQIAGIQDTVELLATAITAKGEVENLDTSERQDILADIRKKRNEQEAKRKQEEATRSQQEFIQRGDAIYAKAKQVFGEDDEALERIEDLLISGRFERAESRIAKAEKANPKQPGGESEEKRIERLVEEKARKILEERGLLTSATNLPSGAGSGKKPTLEELKASNPMETMEKVKKGIWVL